MYAQIFEKNSFGNCLIKYIRNKEINIQYRDLEKSETRIEAWF